MNESDLTGNGVTRPDEVFRMLQNEVTNEYQQNVTPGHTKITQSTHGPAAAMTATFTPYISSDTFLNNKISRSPGPVHIFTQLVLVLYHSNTPISFPVSSGLSYPVCWTLDTGSGSADFCGLLA